MLADAIVSAQADSLEEWSRLWEQNRATAGAGEVAMLMRRAAKHMRRVLDPSLPEPEVETVPVPAEEPRGD